MYSPQENKNAYTPIVRTRQSVFPWRLLVFTGVVLLLTVLIFFGASFGYKPYLEGKITEVNSQLEKITASLQVQDSDVFEVYSQLYNIQSLSKDHTYGSQIFSVLETGTLPNVTLVKAQVDTKKGTFFLQGMAPNYDTVVQQVASYASVDGVTKAQLTSSSQNEDGTVSFSVDMSVYDGFFNQPV